MGNFQIPIYDQKGNQNQLYNAVLASNIKSKYSANEEDMNISEHKKMLKMANKSPKEPNFTMNASMNMGNMLPNLNYNGPNINSMSTSNINRKKISLSSQAPKNTVPNYNQAENLGFVFNQNKLNQSGISPLLNMNMGNNSFYVPQKMKNPHMNNNMWNNLNNSSSNNSNLLNNSNSIINSDIANNNLGGSKSNIFNKKDFNNRMSHNNNSNNNKKYQKLYNYNTHQPFNMNNNNNNNNNNHMNNSNSKNNRINQNIIDNNNNNSNSNKRNSINNPQSVNTNNILRGNKPQKKYLLSIKIKLDNNETEVINIKSLKDTTLLLQQIKEKKNLDDKVVKLIQKKINKTVEIIQKIFDYNLNKYTYKNLTSMNHQLLNHNKEKMEDDVQVMRKRNNSAKRVNKCLEKEILLTMNDVKQAESLNVSY
jgi:hypothetical protein